MTGDVVYRKAVSMPSLDNLATLMHVGVPSILIRKGDDPLDILSKGFETSKRQIREWRDQNAIKTKLSHKNYVVLTIKQRALIIISVLDK